MRAASSSAGARFGDASHRAQSCSSGMYMRRYHVMRAGVSQGACGLAAQGSRSARAVLSMTGTMRSWKASGGEEVVASAAAMARLAPAEVPPMPMRVWSMLRLLLLLLLLGLGLRSQESAAMASLWAAG